MVRKQFFIDEAQEAKLESIAAEQGVSQAQLVRLAIERLITEREQLARASDWQAALALMEARAALGPSLEQRSRVWRREEVYEHDPSRRAR